LGKWGYVRSYGNQMLRMRSAHPKGLYWRGRGAMELGDFPSAVTDLERWREVEGEGDGKVDQWLALCNDKILEGLERRNERLEADIEWKGMSREEKRARREGTEVETKSEGGEEEMKGDEEGGEVSGWEKFKSEMVESSTSSKSSNRSEEIEERYQKLVGWFPRPPPLNTKSNPTNLFHSYLSKCSDLKVTSD